MTEHRVDVGLVVIGGIFGLAILMGLTIGVTVGAARVFKWFSRCRHRGLLCYLPTFEKVHPGGRDYPNGIWTVKAIETYCPRCKAMVDRFDAPDRNYFY